MPSSGNVRPSKKYFQLGIGLALLTIVLHVVLLPPMAELGSNLSRQAIRFLNLASVIIGVGSIIGLVRYKNFTLSDLRTFGRWPQLVALLGALVVIGIIIGLTN